MLNAGSPPLLYCIFQFIISISGAPRLEWIRIRSNPTTDDPRLNTFVDEWYQMHKYLTATIDVFPLHFPSLYHFVSVVTNPPHGLILAGPALNSFATWTLGSDSNVLIYWSEFIETLTASQLLKKVCLDLPVMDDMPKYESISSTPRTTLQHLTEMQLKCSHLELSVLFASFDFPYLEWLQVIYRPLDDGGDIKESDQVLELPFLKRLTWYTHFASNTQIFRTVHAPQLESLDLAAFEPATARAILKQLGFTKPPATVQVRCFGHHSGRTVLIGADLGAIESLSFSPLGSDVRSASEEPFDATEQRLFCCPMSLCYPSTTTHGTR